MKEEKIIERKFPLQIRRLTSTRSFGFEFHLFSCLRATISVELRGGKTLRDSISSSWRVFPANVQALKPSLLPSLSFAIQSQSIRVIQTISKANLNPIFSHVVFQDGREKEGKKFSKKRKRRRRRKGSRNGEGVAYWIQFRNATTGDPVISSNASEFSVAPGFEFCRVEFEHRADFRK